LSIAPVTPNTLNETDMEPLSPTSSTSRNPRLDGLRGLAIALVLVWHYFMNQMRFGGDSAVARVVQAALGMTWSGVDLFFILSGFLIGGILIDQKQSPNFFKVFYARRAWRILPLYFALLAAFVLARFWIGERLGFNWLFANTHPVWQYATFTQHIGMAETGSLGGNWLGVTWSLAIEEQFYLFVPLLVWLLPRRHLFAVVVALVGFTVALRVGVVFFLPEYKYVNMFLTPCRADALLLGVLGAIIVRNNSLRDALKGNAATLYIPWLVLLAGVVLIGLTRQAFVSDLMSIFGYLWLAVFFLATLLLALHEQRGFISTLCGSAFLQQLGMISYGVYLLHQPVSGLLHGCFFGKNPAMNDGSGALVTLLALVLTIVLAKLSFTFFEKPLIGLGHRLHYKKSSESD